MLLVPENWELLEVAFIFLMKAPLLSFKKSCFIEQGLHLKCRSKKPLDLVASLLWCPLPKPTNVLLPAWRTDWPLFSMLSPQPAELVPARYALAPGPYSWYCFWRLQFCQYTALGVSVMTRSTRAALLPGLMAYLNTWSTCRNFYFELGFCARIRLLMARYWPYILCRLRK